MTTGANRISTDLQGFKGTTGGWGFADSIGKSILATDTTGMSRLIADLPDLKGMVAGMTPATAWIHELSELSWFNLPELSGYGIPAQQAATIAAQAAESFQPALAAAREFNSLIDVPGFSSINSMLAGTLPTWLPSVALFETRLTSLAASADLAGDDLPGLESMWRVLDDSTHVRDALNRTVQSASQRGSFGLSYAAIARDAAQLKGALDAEPEIAERLRDPLGHTLDDARLDRHDVIELGTVAGLLQDGRAHQYTATGLFVGCTVGMLHFGGGLMIGLANPIDSIMAGAVAYHFVYRQRAKRMLQSPDDPATPPA